MLIGRYTPEQIIRELRGFGLELFIGEDGIVHGRFREKGRTMTLEMRAAADALQGMNDEVAAILRAENVTEYTGITVEEAMALGDQIKDGKAELVGMVHYHQGTGLVDMKVKGGCGHGEDPA